MITFKRVANVFKVGVDKRTQFPGWYVGWLVFFVCLPLTVFAQYNIEGKVINADTAEPLAYAHVRILDTDYGTVTNSDGFFILNVESDEQVFSILVSHIGFESIMLEAVGEGEFTVKLKPSVITTDELVVSADYELNILKQAIENILADENRLFGNAFYRQVTRTDTIITEFIEAFYGTELISNQINNWKIEHGRYAVVPLDSLPYRAVNLNFSTIFLHRIVSSPPHEFSRAIWPLRQDVGDHYDIYYQTRYEQDGKHLLVFSIEGKASAKLPTFEGMITIDENELEILELNVTLSHPDFNPFSAPYRRTETRNTTFSFHIVREKSINEQYWLSLIEVVARYDLVKKRLLGSTDFKKEVETRAVLFYYDYKAVEHSPLAEESYFEGFEQKHSDIETIDQVNYDPQFWKNNPIIRRTPIEESIITSFERYGSFGSMFNEDGLSQ